MFPLVRELAAGGIPVAVTCRVLDLCRQQYYRWLAAPVTDQELDHAHLTNAVFDAHRDDPEFGYRFLAGEARQAGHDVCDRTVWGSAPTTAGGRCSARRRPARVRDPARRHTER